MTGRFEEIRENWFRDTLEIREYAPAFFHEAAARIMDSWDAEDPERPVTWEWLADLATVIAAEKASAIRSAMEELARDLSEAIRKVSEVLGDESSSAAEDLAAVVKEMPRIDLGSGDLRLKRPWIARINHGLARRKVAKALQGSAGDRIKESFGTFGSTLDAWCRRVSTELQLRFNNYADAQRAQLARLSGGGASEDASTIRAALDEIGGLQEGGASDMESVGLGAKQ